MTQLESGLVAAQLAAVQNDLGHHADARKTLDRYADLSPMMEPETQKWLAARWADTAYFLGEHAAAIEHAKAVKDDFYDAFAARLASGGEVAGLRGREKTDDAATTPRPHNPTTSQHRKVLTLDLAGTPQPTIGDLLARFWKHAAAEPGPGFASASRWAAGCGRARPRRARRLVRPRVHPFARRGRRTDRPRHAVRRHARRGRVLATAALHRGRCDPRNGVPRRRDGPPPG